MAVSAMVMLFALLSVVLMEPGIGAMDRIRTTDWALPRRVRST